MEQFDSYASSFDTPVRFRRAQRIAEEIRKHLPVGQKKSALEFGCGTGLLGMQLLDAFSSLIFMDTSPKMLEKLKEKLALCPSETTRTMLHDLTQTLPEGVKTDLIFTSLVVHHIHDIAGLAQQFYALLHTGGRLMVVDLDSDDGGFHAKYPDFDGHHGFRQDSLASLLRQAGFTAVQSHTFYRDVKYAGGTSHHYSLFLMLADKEQVGAVNKQQ